MTQHWFLELPGVSPFVASASIRRERVVERIRIVADGGAGCLTYGVGPGDLCFPICAVEVCADAALGRLVS